MTSIVGEVKARLRLAIDRVVRRLVAPIVAPIVAELRAEDTEVRFLVTRLIAALDELDVRLTAEQRAVCRDIVRMKPHILAIDALRLKVDDIAIENRRIGGEIESELSEAGAQRSFLFREQNRLSRDLEAHCRECGCTSPALSTGNLEPGG